ncbi:hypothetical protein BD560DRAFT_429703 [Blakeslea trispora]|nr:hypothetical protein BD560DRAFT_429703 [Blakeslea trispora]
MIHWGHGKHFICPVHSSDCRVPTNSGPAVDLQWDSTITFVQRTPNCCTNNRRPSLNLAAVDVLLGVVVEYNLPTRYNSNKRRFKSQVQEHKRRRKVRLNLVRLRKLPLEVAKQSVDSSERIVQSDRSI